MNALSAHPDHNGEALRADYEQVRRKALARYAPTSEAAGYGLIIHRGLASWMQAWSGCLPLSRPGFSRTSNRVVLPRPVESEVIDVLSALVLADLDARSRPGMQSFEEVHAR